MNFPPASWASLPSSDTLSNPCLHAHSPNLPQGPPLQEMFVTSKEGTLPLSLSARFVSLWNQFPKQHAFDVSPLIFLILISFKRIKMQNSSRKQSIYGNFLSIFYCGYKWAALPSSFSSAFKPSKWPFRVTVKELLWQLSPRSRQIIKFYRTLCN